MLLGAPRLTTDMSQRDLYQGITRYLFQNAAAAVALCLFLQGPRPERRQKNASPTPPTALYPRYILAGNHFSS